MLRAAFRLTIVMLVMVAFLTGPQARPSRGLAQAERVCAVAVVSVAIGSGGGRNADNTGVVLGGPEGTRAPFLSLGRGGTLVVQLGGAGVSADGTPASDLFVYESGTQAEFVFVSLSVDGTTYVPVGATGSQASGIDLDAAGFAPGTSYGYVQVQDDPNQGSHTGPETGGADVDAICGFNTANRAPVAGDNVASFTVGDDYALNDLLGNDSDPDGNPLTIESFTQPDGGIGVVTLDDTGRATFVPTDPNFVGDVVFTYTVVDGQGGRAVATVTFTIAGASASASSSPSMRDSPSASPSDVASDSGEPSESPSAPASEEASVSGSASPSSEPSMSASPSEAPPASDRASEEPTVVPSADESLEPSDEPTIEPTAVPSMTDEPSPDTSVPPVASAILFDGAVELPLDGDLVGDLTSLVDNPDGAALVFGLVAPPVSGDLLVDPAGPFTYVPVPGFTGTDRFVFTLTVNGGDPVEASVELTVSADCTDGANAGLVSGTPVTADAVVDEWRPCTTFARTGSGVVVSGGVVDLQPTVPAEPGSGSEGAGGVNGGGTSVGGTSGGGVAGGGGVGGGDGEFPIGTQAVVLPNTGSGSAGGRLFPLAGLTLAVAVVLAVVGSLRRWLS